MGKLLPESRRSREFTVMCVIHVEVGEQKKKEEKNRTQLEGQVSPNYHSGHFYVINFPLELSHSQWDNMRRLLKEPVEIRIRMDNKKAPFILERCFPICTSNKNTLVHLQLPV